MVIKAFKSWQIPHLPEKEFYQHCLFNKRYCLLFHLPLFLIRLAIAFLKTRKVTQVSYVPFSKSTLQQNSLLCEGSAWAAPFIVCSTTKSSLCLAHRGKRKSYDESCTSNKEASVQAVCMLCQNGRQAQNLESSRAPQLCSLYTKTP